jgi:hypothetical protein
MIRSKTPGRAGEARAGHTRVKRKMIKAKIGVCLLEIAPLIHPAQFLQSFFVGFARQVIERVAQMICRAPLKIGVCEGLANRGAQA